jgi:hypothetical protein
MGNLPGTIGVAGLALVWPVLSALLALFGALGVSYAVFRGATVTKTLELYKIENEALGKSVARLREEQDVLGRQVKDLEAQNRVLENVVTGKAAIEHLTTEMMAAEGARREEHATMMVVLRDLLGQLKDIWDMLGRPGRSPGTGEIGRA